MARKSSSKGGMRRHGPELEGHANMRSKGKSEKASNLGSKIMGPVKDKHANFRGK